MVTGHRVEFGYRITIPAPSGKPTDYRGPLGFYLPSEGGNILNSGIHTNTVRVFYMPACMRDHE